MAFPGKCAAFSVYQTKRYRFLRRRVFSLVHIKRKEGKPAMTHLL